MRPQSPCGTAGETGSESHSDSSEDILGINPESTGLVAAAIAAAAALLAIAVWFTRLAVVLAVIAFGLVFAAFDVREVVHQVNESRARLVIIACVLVPVHLGVSLLAAVLLRAGPQFGIRAAPFVHPRGRRYGLSGPIVGQGVPQRWGLALQSGQPQNKVSKNQKPGFELALPCTRNTMRSR